MKKTLVGLAIIASALININALQAQETVPATGGEATGEGGTSSYSVGQITYTTDNGTNGSVAKGVQQPYEISIVTGIEATNINLELSVYPNPTTDRLTLAVKDTELNNLKFQLYDLSGKLIQQDQLRDQSTQISMQSLSAGTYLLKVSDNTKTIKIFKIIRNN
ncbi:MAG: T9SS type A sorting domain-containing protein [Flavobacteriales bacterium]|nr:T9SS type A sorting domain-containing protein [Flavobacteriales bacterium]